MNPLIRRGIRERLRAKNLLASGIFSLILTSTFYLASFFDGMHVVVPAKDYAEGTAEITFHSANGAREAFTPLLFLQGFFLMFWEPAGSPRSPPRKRSPACSIIKG